MNAHDLVNQTPPRQLGSLHQRAAYLLGLVDASLPEFARHHPVLNHAVWDLVDMVAELPDVAFEDDGAGPLVPLSAARRPKLGILKTEYELHRDAQPEPQPR